MRYRIIVDKQPRTNATSELRLYDIDIEELRFKGDICDTLVITKDEDYVIRRLSLNEYNVLSVLPEPVKEPLQDINIELFEGDNYIYLMDMTGNKFYAEYLVKNDFTDMYVTVNQMNSLVEQTAEKINISVEKKLDKNDFKTELEINSEAVKIAWNKITDFIQMMIYKDNASLVILDENKKAITSLDKNGQHFYKNDKVFADIGLFQIGSDEKEKGLMFLLNNEEHSVIKDGCFMGWGYRDVTEAGEKMIFPIIYLGKYSDMDDFGLHIMSDINMSSNRIVFSNMKVYGTSYKLFVCDENDNTLLCLYHNKAECYCLDLHENTITNVGYLYANSINAESISARFIEQTSLKSEKRNIKKLNIDALELVKNADICSYNLKTEKRRSQKAYRTCNRRRLQLSRRSHFRKRKRNRAVFLYIIII